MSPNEWDILPPQGLLPVCTVPVHDYRSPITPNDLTPPAVSQALGSMLVRIQRSINRKQRHCPEETYHLQALLQVTQLHLLERNPPEEVLITRNQKTCTPGAKGLRI
ncbi:unnamed protein product [Rangifer tarandus platyrhynchus]|uniref:Uncharacterized protein n=2 Tax=Rangifer tarandus platyrhynchus TaxID=3082113 RepID=A0AC59ZP70_RANTA|nr:unnamed protein product [Rangifer tarandus platyrhynchus]